jgi:hypothetical protein
MKVTHILWKNFVPLINVDECLHVEKAAEDRINDVAFVVARSYLVDPVKRSPQKEKSFIRWAAIFRPCNFCRPWTSRRVD